MISLAGGIPDPDAFPLVRLADIAAAAVADRGRDTLQYGLTAGEPQLRAAVASQHGAVDEDRVLITTGSQQGLDLLARCLVDPGDVVVCAEPDYLGALQTFRAHGATLEALPVDADGIRVDVLEARLEAGLTPKAVYVVPNFHNPTGATLDLLRRLALERLAASHGFVVIEDDPYRELAFDGPVASPGAPPANVVHLGSVSKVLAPGLRVGWMVGPEWLLEAVAIAKQAADLHTSTLTQAIVAEAITAPWFGEHLDGLRAHYRAKRDRFVDELQAGLGDRLEFHPPRGGMFVWCRDTEGLDSGRLLSTALDHGVCFVPGAAFAVADADASAFRLSFATLADDEIGPAVDRLARSLEACANVVAAHVH